MIRATGFAVAWWVAVAIGNGAWSAGHASAFSPSPRPAIGGPVGQAAPAASTDPSSDKPVRLGAFEPGLPGLDVWNDGFSEMSYYRASDVIYGKRRAFTRVQLVNRQWLSRETGVKTGEDDPQAERVLKFNIAEQIPTENYNYRYLTTVFLRRADLMPMKMVLSSQEWCGTTFKHLRWRDDGLTVQSFSYFDNEGDKTWHVDGNAVPYDALGLVAREVVASGRPIELNVLKTLRSNHERKPEVVTGTLSAGESKVLRTPAGTFETRLVRLVWNGEPTEFRIETTAPYRLIAFSMGNLTGTLNFVERRAYWDRSWKSGTYAPEQAP